MANPEKLPSQEHKESAIDVDTEKERLREELESSVESSVEKDQDTAIEKARKSIEKEYAFGHEKNNAQKGSEKRSQRQRHNISKADKKRSYATTMRHIRRNMPTTQRTFSRFIHAPLVEKTSEVASTTVARPSGILGAGIVAVTGLGYVLYTAKQTGFSLSGTEFIVFLAIGWMTGIFIEFTWKLAQRFIKL